MSEGEEPPMKMSKYEEFLDNGEEGLEEGQEEWLSEDVLTDDDFHVNTTDVKIESNLEEASQVEHDASQLDQEMEQLDNTNGPENAKTDHNIEDTLNNLDSKTDVSKEINTFIIRNPHVKPEATPSEEKPLKQEKELIEDDGNDTDDLLRLLEDNQHIKKKTIKLVKHEQHYDQDSTDDDEFIYERSNVKHLKLAKNAIIKQVPTKAEPEVTTDSEDESDVSDTRTTMKNMFGVKKTQIKINDKQMNSQTKYVKNINNSSSKPKPQVQTKPTSNINNIESKQIKITPANKNVTYVKTKSQKTIVRQEKPIKILPKMENGNTLKLNTTDNIHYEEDEEMINEEEFLEDDNFELDEEVFGEELIPDNTSRQRIMKPEVMDEEVPSDDDSRSEDGSLYDELPSSDSEDFDDWFTLDIRAERASDYLPLLGPSAGALLSSERRRAAEKVSTLRKSLSALTESSRRQAEALRSAAMALAEIDDTLRAS